MATLSTGSTGLSGQYQKVFSKKLLEHAVQALVMDQFAYKVPFPKNAGSKQIRFTKPDVGDRTQVQDLTAAGEGTPISTFRDYTLHFTDITLNQYGEATKITDILTLTDLFNSLKNSVKVMGEDAALHADYQIINALVGGGVSGNKRYSGGATSFASLTGLGSNAAGALSFDDVLGAMTKLQINRAPKINGEYVLVLCPQVGYDLMRDSKFVVTSEYGTSKGLFNGEIGRWYGTRAVITTAPWIESAEGTYNSGGTVFTSVVLGQQAYAVPEMAGQSEFSPKVIINDKPDKSDPLNQFITAGWKAYWAVGVIDATWYMLVRSRITFA